MMRRRTRLPLLLAAAGMLTACAGRATDDAPPATATASVPTAVARAAAEPVLVEVTGSIEARSVVSPGTKILGRVEDAPVRVGDRVARGQTLARLERRDLEAAVRQAEAAVAMAEADLDNAAAHHRRILELHERGSVTDKNLEDATAAQRRATAGLEQARANLAAAGVMLDYADVRSPLDGWVTAKRVEAGDMAAPGAALFTIEDLSRVKVLLEVAEGDVVGLERGAPVRIGVDALGREWEARVERVNPSGETPSRTYRVELSLPNPEGLLKAGMFARAWLPRGERDALRVPDSAIVRRGQLEGVFVVADDGIARLRWLRTGRRGEAGLEVLSGLAAGEIYVTAPPAGFADGTRVAER